MLDVVLLSDIVLSIVMLNAVMLSDIVPSIVMLNVVMLSDVVLSVVMLSVVMLSVVMLSVVMLSDVVLSIVMLSVIMLSAVAPFYIPVHYGGRAPGACIIKLITAVIYSFCNKLECWSLASLSSVSSFNVSSV